MLQAEWRKRLQVDDWTDGIKAEMVEKRIDCRSINVTKGLAILRILQTGTCKGVTQDTANDVNNKDEHEWIK